MRINKIHRPSVVTRRAAAELTGAVTYNKRVRPNNNKNNRAALAERFQPSTLHKLRQLGLYTNTDTPGIADQLDAEVMAAEVAYTVTNAQPRCSGGRELDRIPNIFK